MIDLLRDVADLARTLGVDGRPTIVADRSNLVVALEPHPVLARIAMATSATRVGLEWLKREVEIARFLGPDRSTQPSERLDAGPHLLGDRVVSFWRRESLIAARDPAAVGRALASCHRALARYPKDALPWLGGWAEAKAVLPRALRSVHVSPRERADLERAFDRGERVVADAAARSAMQAIHGDAHLGNALATERGVLLTDWEDACVGPIELDLACLRSKADLFGEDVAAIEAAIDAYDVEHDRELVRALGPVRNAQVVAWLAVFAERQPELVPRMRARLARL